MDKKTCSHCSKEKEIEKFNKDKTRRDGFQPSCRECVNESQRNSYKRSEKRIQRAKRVKKEREIKLTRTEKECVGCLLTKPLEDFYNDNTKKTIDGKYYRCKKCVNLINSKNRRKYIITQYGISIEEFDAMVVKQKGVCAICEKPPKKQFIIDHDHETGAVRGLLCRKCNVGIGLLNDNFDTISAARKYLKK